MRLRWFLLHVLLASLVAGWTSASAQPVINEIHFDPPEKTEPAEFIELFNPSATPLWLDGWRLGGGIRFTFPSPTTIPAQGYLVVAQDPAFIRTRFGTDALGPWTGRLRNEDERIELLDPAGTLIDRVGFQLGFPWPTVGTPPGNSIELIHPSLDNELGGNWRASAAAAAAGPSRTALIPPRSTWLYLRGLAEPSAPATAWRDPGFDDTPWASGPLPVGYDPALTLGTVLGDMRNTYTTVYLRRTFDVPDPSKISALEFRILYDDGFRIWVNGRFVVEANLAPGELPPTATAGPARESNDYETFSVNLPAGTLVPGRNTIAVQALNSSLGGSSDFFFDAQMDGVSGPTGQGPTPGRINLVHATNAPPAIRQADHAPNAPRTGESVRISARITDPQGVAEATLAYQIVEPGAYIELGDAAYSTQWTRIPMRDDGTGGDAVARDGTFTATVPGDVQRHRRLVRYRILARDGGGLEVQTPYPDDPEPNFAYFVYDGVPAWTGAVKPGDAGTLGKAFTVSSNEMNRLPVLHLLAKKTAVEDSTWFSRYGGDAYLWTGTLVFNGRVYDHIHYRARGGVWRYAMTKNMWKFDFNRGHDFQAVDDWGRPLDVRWTKLNLGASIQQGDFNHRGEHGMFESTGFRIFRLAGVPAMHSAFTQFRIIDEVNEAPANDQYGGDFWGVYLMLEQPDGRFLEHQGLPDGNLYKMEGGGGEANNVGPAGPADGADLASFLQDYNSTSETWWKENLNLPNYLSYQTVVQAIHHYDICYDKNFFYYRNPETAKWQVVPWDLDLTWAENMFDSGCGGVDRIKQRLLPSASRFPAVWRAWQNRIREFRDLFWNADEASRLIDEQAGRLRGPSDGPTVLDADRAQWDYNPRMADPSYSSAGTSKAGQGRYYKWPDYPATVASRSFDGCLQIMKRYVGYRGTNSGARARALDLLAADPAIPNRPTLVSASPPDHPVNALRFRCSAYSGAAPFSKIRWRVGEVTRPTPGNSSALATEPWKYEITPSWESGDLTSFDAEIAVPQDALRVGGTYRARVQFQDAEGRDSQWSEAVEFVAGAPEALVDASSSLRLTELMFNAQGGSTNDFLELHNAGTTTLSLGGMAFTSGIDYVIPAGTTLAPGAYLIITKAPATGNFAAFRAFYSLSASVPVLGPYSGNLSDAGESLILSAASGLDSILSVTYGDGRGWPVAADGSGHSLVPRRDFGPAAGGALDFGGNWRASAFLRGSPGRADPEPDTSIVLNEIVAHTDFLSEFDSNDWIELYNRTDSPITLGAGWYLSDRIDSLRQWPIPATTVIPAHGFVVFDEVTGFNNPRGTGFSINKAGESIFLSQFANGTPGRVVDAVSFKSQENEWSLARVPDGGNYWDALSPRSRGTSNPPLAPRVVLSELLYHEGGFTSTDVPTDLREFIEIHNANGAPVNLFSVDGTWRLSGGVTFSFSTPVTLDAGERVLFVPWNPSTNTTVLAGFRRLFNVPNSVRIFGPYSGRLDNDTDRVALERPQAPDIPGDPITWVIVDEITYHDSTPWPGGADGSGMSYQRLSALVPGNDPASWVAAIPSPGSGIPTGSTDTDGDSMPDAWETQFGFNPRNPADAIQDADADGLSNAGEYAAGTDPRNSGSALRLKGPDRTGPSQFSFRFDAVAGRGYVVEVTSDAGTGSWTVMQMISAPTQTQEINVPFSPGTDNGQRLYRVRLR